MTVTGAMRSESPAADIVKGQEQPQKRAASPSPRRDLRLASGGPVAVPVQAARRPGAAVPVQAARRPRAAVPVQAARRPGAALRSGCRGAAPARIVFLTHRGAERRDG
jgi:hypothetical protein